MCKLTTNVVNDNNSILYSTTNVDRVCLQIFIVENFHIKHFNSKMYIFGIKFSWISINFMKIQIDTSYYAGNIRRQNGFVFHMHAK